MTSNKGDNLSEVSIGNVSGGIHGSVIGGRDVKNVTIAVGGKEIPADKEPNVDELRQILSEAQQSLAGLTAQKEVLVQVSISAPFTAQGAAASIEQAAQTVAADEVDEEQAKSAQKSLEEATTLLGGILDGAKTAAEKATEVGKAAKPIAEALAPLVEKLAVASFWVGRLWLGL